MEKGNAADGFAELSEPTERIKFEGDDVALIRKNMKFWVQIGVQTI